MPDPMLLGSATALAVGTVLIARSLLVRDAAPVPAIASAGAARADLPTPSSNGNGSATRDDDVLEREETVPPTAPVKRPAPGDFEDHPTMPFALILVNAIGQTDRGRKRENNEDSLLVMEDKHLFVVCDGMGGHQAGEVASRMAVDTIERAFRTGNFDGEPDPARHRLADELVRAVKMANKAVHADATSDRTHTGMGTTLVGARFSPNKQRVYIAHVGDSRCYRLRHETLTQVTSDHTLAHFGVTGPAGAKLLRSVGTEPNVQVDLITDEPQAGDVYLLCSDGLSRMVPDEMITEILRAETKIDTALEKLIATANERGGADNITVVLVRVDPMRSPAA